MLCIKKGIVGDADPYVNISVHLGSFELLLQLFFA